MNRPTEEMSPARARRMRNWDPFEAMRELMRWSPFQEMAPRTGQESDGQRFLPAFDVRETEDSFLFTADVPGFREEDIDVQVSGNRLTITGRREAEDCKDTDTFYCAERSYGEFTRSFTFPDGVDVNGIDAELRAGVLHVRLPKQAESPRRQIKLRRSDDEQAGQTKPPRRDREQGQRS
jgi:HSP20 family protein